MATTFNTLGTQDRARVNNANEIHIYNGPVYIYNIACNHVCNHACTHSVCLWNTMSRCLLNNIAI